MATAMALGADYKLKVLERAERAQDGDPTQMCALVFLPIRAQAEAALVVVALPQCQACQCRAARLL